MGSPGAFSTLRAGHERRGRRPTLPMAWNSREGRVPLPLLRAARPRWGSACLQSWLQVHWEGVSWGPSYVCAGPLHHRGRRARPRLLTSYSQFSPPSRSCGLCRSWRSQHVSERQPAIGDPGRFGSHGRSQSDSCHYSWLLPALGQWFRSRVVTRFSGVHLPGPPGRPLSLVIETGSHSRARPFVGPQDTSARGPLCGGPDPNDTLAAWLNNSG